MSHISALLNAASSSHSSNERDLLSLTLLSSALLDYSGSDYPARYSDAPPSYSPPHSRKSNSPSTPGQYYLYSSASSSYLLTPPSLVHNLPLSSKSSPSYSADNSFSYPSPCPETAIVDSSYLAQGHDSVDPYSMSRPSATMISHPRSTGLPTSTPPQRPPTHNILVKKPAGHKQKKRFTCYACSRAFSCNAHLVRHFRVHTGERNHKCPFPGCEAQCSRLDNLQQHYRTHFITGSRQQTIEWAMMHARIAGLMNGVVHDNHGPWDPEHRNVCLLPHAPVAWSRQKPPPVRS